MDALVDLKIVDPPEAARALQLMMEADRRLPKEEVDRRIDKWSR